MLNSNRIFQVCLKKRIETATWGAIQKRPIYHRYPHGPHKRNNPSFPYAKAIRETLTKEGFHLVKESWIRYIKSFKKYNDVLWREHKKPYIFEHFDSDEAIKEWRTVADSDTQNGFSRAYFSRSPSGHGLFHGNLDTSLPDDGMTEHSGMVALCGPHNMSDAPWRNDGSWDWSKYNSIQLRFRGDGRRYGLVIVSSSYNNDLTYYNYYLYPFDTRGGPYWQTRTIRFSKFSQSSAGYSQDEQCKLNFNFVKSFCIRLNDTYSGPFSLEIDYVALVNDILPYEEETAYESYVVPHESWLDVAFYAAPPEKE